MKQVFYASHRSVTHGELMDEVARGGAAINRSLEAGQAVIVRGFIEKARCCALIEYLRALPAERYGDRLHMVEGCRDAIQSVDTSGLASGYRTINRSFYFFKFNNDPGPQTAIGEEMHRAQKLLSGLTADQFSRNTPKDIVIDRLEIINYQMASGFVSCHSDPDDTMKVNVGLYLTEYGKDYDEGGFYVIDGKGSRVHLDPYVQAGDLLLWYPTVPHGVDPVRPCAAAKSDGRWFMSANSVWSHVAKERPKSLPWENVARAQA